MRILTVPEDSLILRQKSRPILKIDDELLAFLKELGETLTGQKDPAGVGLSAIQVGKPIRAFATLLPPNKFGSAPKESYLASWSSSTPAKSDPSGFGRTSGFLQNKNPGPSEKTKPGLTFYINPEIVEHAAQMTPGEELTENSKQKIKNRHQKPFLEGCLSVPRIYGAVLRWSWIRAKTIIIDEDQLQLISNIRYQISNIRLDGLHSRIFQHEMDHLDGILFTDHVVAEGGQLYRWDGDKLVEMTV